MWQGEGWALREVALLHLVLAGLFASVGLGSESPDRDCCDSLYPFIPAPEVTQSVPYYTDYPYPLETTKKYQPPVIDVWNDITTKPAWGPPEEPDIWIVNPRPQTTAKTKTKATTTIRSNTGFVTTGPSTAAISCLVARQLCSEQKTCSQILEVIPKTCGLELATCSTNTVTKCQAALRTLKGFDFFSPTCLCKEPRVEPKCNQLQNFIFDHPCDVASSFGNGPYPNTNHLDALPTCSQAQRACNKDRNCFRIYKNYQNACRVDRDGKCRMENWWSCKSAWADLRLTPLFGCICPTAKKQAQQAKCDKIFNIVNGNPCIDARFFAFSSTDYDHREAAVSFWQVWLNVNFTNEDYASFFYNDITTYISRVTPTTGVRTSRTERTERSRTTRTTSAVQTSETSVRTSDTSPGKTVSDTSGASNGNLNIRSTCHLALDACERDGSCNRYLDQIKRMCGSINCDKQKCMKSIRDFYSGIPEKHRLDIAFCLCKNVPSPDERCLQAQSILHPVCAIQPESLPGAKPPSCHEIAASCKMDPRCRDPYERFEQACAVDSTTQNSCAGRPDNCRKAMIGILGTELRTNCDCNSVTADFYKTYECMGVQRILWANRCMDEANKDYHRTTVSIGGGNRITDPPYNPPSEPTTKSTIWEPISPYRPTNPRTKQTIPPSTPRITWPNYNTATTKWQPWTPFPTNDNYLTDDEDDEKFVMPKWPKRRKPKKQTQSTVPTTTTTTTTTLPPQFCSVERPGQPVRYIREGYKKRLYKHDDPECSELCECELGEKLFCKVLECIKRDACNTGVAFYSHASPFYQAYRGACLCYSGSFVCSKPDRDVELNLKPGVYLFLGYSEKDEKLLKAVTDQGAEEARGAIQGMVSFHNINNNKSDCRIISKKQTPENLVLQAVMDEHEENREKGNLTAEILNKEKDECFEALKSIQEKIMSKDADMRSHVILSMIKVAKAEAIDVPNLPSSATSSKLFQFKGSCSSLHVAGTCCSLTNILVVFNLIIILLCSNCQVMFAL